MGAPLLTTKFYIPPPRPDLVPRLRLFERLDEAPARKLTLISAPAGFGKTTLLTAWLQSRREQASPPDIAWVSLDEGDNDPARFLSYVSAALQRTCGVVDWVSRTLLEAPQLPPVESVLTLLINDVAALLEGTREDRPLLLALDDYHRITAVAVHEAITFLLDHLPPTMHLVILTRIDPPLPLARLRARDELAEIRAEHLRFTPDEAAVFFQRTARVSLSAEDIAALEARTEGWVAALQMAALSLQDAADPHAFITAFRGDDRYIADYLLDEVLRRQPAELQQFLMQTSILDRVSGPLCDAVTGRRDSQTVLNLLERANLFLIPLDSRREWFRYHSLFAGLLRQWLVDTSGPSAVQALQRRAWQWYAAHDMATDAIEYALSCGDWHEAAGLIEQTGQQYFTGSGMNMLFRWLEVLPAPVISAHLRLLLMAAWAAHASGHPQACERFVELIEQSVGLTIDRFLEATPAPQELPSLQESALIEAAVARSRTAVDRFDLAQTFALGERVLPYLNRERDQKPFAFNRPSGLYGPVLFMLGLAHKFRGDLRAAVQALDEAATEALRTNNIHIIALSLGHLGEVQTLQGRLRQAEKTFRRALEIADSFPPHSTAFFGMASVGLGNLAYERNDLAEADLNLQAGLELGRLWNSWECLLPGYIGLARLRWAQAKPEPAFCAFDELLGLAERNARIVRPTVEAWRALLALRKGDVAEASRWAATADARMDGELRLVWEQNALVLARLHLAQGRAAEAGLLLDRLLADAEEGDRGGRSIEILCLQALSLEARQEREAALLALARALELAEPEGYVRLFVDEGVLVERLLRQIRARGMAPREGYIAGLLSAMPLAEATPPPVSPALAEPLTERELEVLRLVAAGRSNQEIASELVVATGTVKKHINNIFGKMNAQSRTQCVARARELHLIP